jgi:hypothetical protein
MQRTGKRHLVLASGIGLLLGASLMPAAGPSSQAGRTPDEYIRVEVRGTLRTGVVAIGAETTGTTITSNGVTWELEFGKNKQLREQAEKLGDSLVTVEGTLERRKGVEIKERWIVHVAKLKPAAK